MRVCRECKQKITKENLVRNSAYGGHQNICRPCKSLESKKYALKKRKLIKQSQWRSYYIEDTK